MRLFVFIICCLFLSISQYTVFSSQKAKIKSVTASSTLSDKKNRYVPENITDRAIDSWCEGKKGDGIGESITITFDENIVMTEFTIMNGYGDDKNVMMNDFLKMEGFNDDGMSFWLKNNRVKNLKISNEKKKEVIVTLENTNDKQSVKLPESIEGKTFTFTIQSVYRGTLYQDTCITELDVSDFSITKSKKKPALTGSIDGKIKINEIFSFAGFSYSDSIDKAVAKLGKPAAVIKCEDENCSFSRANWVENKEIILSVFFNNDTGNTKFGKIFGFALYTADINTEEKTAGETLRNFLASKNIKDNTASLLGAKKSDILKMFGEPVSSVSNDFITEIEFGDKNTLIFTFSNVTEQCTRINIHMGVN